MLNIYDESTLQEIKCDFIWLVLHVIRKAVRPNYISKHMVQILVKRHVPYIGLDFRERETKENRSNIYASV